MMCVEMQPPPEGVSEQLPALLGALLAELDRQYVEIRAACADPAHLNGESREMRVARERFDDIVRQCFALKGAVADAVALLRHSPRGPQ
jgi:hypothetical protein